MSEHNPIEWARPILEDWAKDAGVRIQWLHEWTRDGLHHVTAFGLDSANAHRHNTVSWPLGEAPHAGVRIQWLHEWTRDGLHQAPHLRLDPNIDRMADRLAKECIRLFGTRWSQESARCFARVALDEAKRMRGE